MVFDADYLISMINNYKLLNGLNNKIQFNLIKSCIIVY